MSNHPICGDCAEKLVSNCHQGVATMEPCRLIPYREAYDALRAEVDRLKQQLADERELPTIAYMSGYHDRDDEVRALRAMCDEFACTILESGRVTREQRESLGRYRAMTATGKDGE